MGGLGSKVRVWGFKVRGVGFKVRVQRWDQWSSGTSRICGSLGSYIGPY